MFRSTNQPEQVPTPQPQAPQQPAPQPAANPGVGGPQASYGPTAASDQTRTAPDQPYSFITNPVQPPKPSLLSRLPGGNSIIIRIGAVVGGLLVLFIIFSAIKGLFSSSLDLTSFPGIVQDQQELIHLATNAVQEPSLSTSNQNLAGIMELSLTTSQTKTVKYMAQNHLKINAKQANLKVSTAIDGQLTAAAAATTYNQTFDEIVQTKLNTYGAALQQAYKQDKGKNGRALLQDSYRQMQLFQVQLNSANN